MPPSLRNAVPDRPLSFVKLPLPPPGNHNPSTGPTTNASSQGKTERKAAWFEQVQKHFLELQNQYSNLESDVRELEVAGSLWIKLTDRVEKLEASQKQANSVSGDGASTVCLAELKAKIMQLEGRLEKQEGQLGQQAQHLAQERCSGRGGPALEKQVQGMETMLLRQQQQQQQRVDAVRAMQVSALEKKLDELQTCVSQISACSTPFTPNAASSVSTTSSTQLTLLKKQVTDLEDLLTQQQQAQRLSQQEVNADLSSLGHQLKDLEQWQVQQQQQAKRSHDLVAVMEKQVKEAMEQQQVANSSILGYNRQIAALERHIKDLESVQQQALLQFSSTAVDNSSQLMYIQRRLEELGVGGELKTRGSSSEHSVLSKEHRIGEVLRESRPLAEHPSSISCTDLDLKDLKEVTRRLQSQQTILAKQQNEIASKCNPEVMDIMQDALSEAAHRLTALERDQDAFKNTFVKASAMKELENYLLERLSMQSEPMKKVAKTVDILVADAQRLAIMHNLPADPDGPLVKGECSLQPYTLTGVLRKYVTVDALTEKYAQIGMVEKVSERARANNELLFLALKELDAKSQQLAKEVYEKTRKNDEVVLMAMKDLDTKFEQSSDTQANVMLRIAQQIDYVQNLVREVSQTTSELADKKGTREAQPSQLLHSNSMPSSGAVQELLAARHSMQAEESVVDRAIRNARYAEPPVLASPKPGSLEESLLGQVEEGAGVGIRVASKPLSRSTSGGNALRKLQIEPPDSPLQQQSNSGVFSNVKRQSTGIDLPRAKGKSSSGLSGRCGKALELEPDENVQLAHERFQADSAESIEGDWDTPSPLRRAGVHRSSKGGTRSSSQVNLTGGSGSHHRGLFLQRAHHRASSANHPRDDTKAPPKSPSMSPSGSQKLTLMGAMGFERDSQIRSAPANLVWDQDAHKSCLEPKGVKRSGQRKLQSTSSNSLGE